MNYSFEKMSTEHEKQVMDIFNYYIRNTFAAYPESELPTQFYVKFLEIAKNYPAFVIKDEEDKVIGFCMLRPYHPFPVFKETAEVSYFIHKDFVNKGIGDSALKKLEESAVQIGIKKLLADISSENIQSINFHLKKGFNQCGVFKNAGMKFGKNFDVVWMEKDLIG